MAGNVLHLGHCYLGDGSKTLLWCEKWLHGQFLSDLAPSLWVFFCLVGVAKSMDR